MKSWCLILVKKLICGLPEEVMADPYVKRAYLGLEESEETSSEQQAKLAEVS